MVKREYWIKEILDGWRKKNVLWLSGVRRVGKTYLSQSLPGVEYFDCELPRVRKIIEEDPQSFLEGLKGKSAVLDEIHRLGNPSEILKITADHYPDVRILATGSSTLGASKRFRDTLTGRKVGLWLTPMIPEDTKDFGNTDLKHRFIHGGLPPFFLSGDIPERDFQEWMDDYWAKDIQELFRFEKRYSFLRFAELLLARSGGIFEATQFARLCEVSRTTISNYLSVLESTFVAHVIRPFSTHRPTEIVSAPKVYGFDTGFVCYFKGWHTLRNEDNGYLWEHFVLNEIQAKLQTRRMLYWRDKQGREIDFILPQRKNTVAIECKWASSEFDHGNLKAFRKLYPEGSNLIVSADVDRPFERRSGELVMKFVSLKGLIDHLKTTGPAESPEPHKKFSVSRHPR